jgi:hypothetical protein
VDAITELRKTGYYVTHGDDSTYRDAGGHMWFSKELARNAARAIGGMYHDGSKTTVKEVVTGYVREI